MDIKKRIDGLTEREAKAALWAFCRSQGNLNYVRECGANGTIEDYSIMELDEVLEEVREWI